jgi:quercetin dioxygenase-like cupin family protein
MTTSTPNALIPEAFTIASDDLPFADDWSGFKGVRLKLLLADVEGGKFVVRIKFAPGTQLPPHKHTGEVHAFTLAGEWSYLEYKDAPSSKAGSYLYEPPNSTHTLKVADHNTSETDVIFVVYGAMLHMDAAGTIVAVGDAESHLRDWPEAIRKQNGGKPIGTIAVGGAMGYRGV